MKTTSQWFDGVLTSWKHVIEVRGEEPRRFDVEKALAFEGYERLPEFLEHTRTALGVKGREVSLMTFDEIVDEIYSNISTFYKKVIEV